MRPVGFYVHHQGRGHAARVQQIVAHLQRPATVFCSSPDYFGADLAAEVIALPLDYGEPGSYPQERSPCGKTLHYAPLDVAGLRQRMTRIAAWVADRRPALMVVDVSVEVLTFCRLLSVPTVAVRLQGRRDDPAHLSAFAHARAILCPFAPGMEDSRLPAALEAKCFYTGAYSRFARLNGKTPPATPPATPRSTRKHILVLLGSGGHSLDLRALTELAKAVPDRVVHVLGEVAGASSGNLRLHGVQPRVEDWLARAELVVGGGGSSVCYEVGAFRKPFVCLPEARAYGEQASNAAGLERLGLAVVVHAWPSAAEWPAVLAQAMALETESWAKLFYDPELRQTAALLEGLAAECD